MPTNAEIAYTESIRTLEGQAQDLANIRGHVNLALSAGGVAAAFLGTQTAAHGVAFWVAVGAFAALAGLTILVYRPIEFAYDFDGYQLVNDSSMQCLLQPSRTRCESSPCMLQTTLA